MSLYQIDCIFQERISSLKAGLKTWEDHLVRIQGLRDEFKSEVEGIEKELAEVGQSLDQEEEEEDVKGSTLQDKLLQCQVSQILFLLSFMFWGHYSTFKSRNTWTKPSLHTLNLANRFSFPFMLCRPIQVEMRSELSSHKFDLDLGDRTQKIQGG